MKKLGKDEHKKSRGKRFMAQTPKSQLSDGYDIEFSEELADDEDKEALKRSRQANQRAKKN